MNKKTQPGLKIICINRKASFNYFFEDLIEAGIVLKGSEIKSIREGKVNIGESYAVEKDGDIFLVNSHIASYRLRLSYVYNAATQLGYKVTGGLTIDNQADIYYIGKVTGDVKSIVLENIPELKKLFSSSYLTSLQSSATKTQKWPLINLIRQILRSSGYNLTPKRLCDGYTSGGVKKYRRIFIIEKQTKASLKDPEIQQPQN